jgi:hypothetical protein
LNAFNFNKTQSTGGGRSLHVFKVAQVGDVDPVVKTCLKQSLFFFGLNLLIVHLNFGHNSVSRNIKIYDNKKYLHTLSAWPHAGMMEYWVKTSIP